MPLGAKMGPGPPPDSSQDRCLWILDPNLVDFGPHLGGFWTPSWWILGVLGTTTTTTTNTTTTTTTTFY